MLLADEVPDYMKQPTNGEDWYIFYDEYEVEGWFGEERQRKYRGADSPMELFNFAYFCKDPECARLILEHPLCDKGVAVMLFWRLKSFANCYTSTNILLDEIKCKIKGDQYKEIIAYNPMMDDNISLFNKVEERWKIPEAMKKAV